MNTRNQEKKRMKKIMMLILAMMFVFGVTGQAMASFTTGELVEVLYSSAGTEYAVDLGSAATLAAAVSAPGSQVDLGNSGASGLPANVTGYTVAYFAMTPLPGTTAWFSGGATAPVTNSSSYPTTQVGNVDGYYKNHSSAALTSSTGYTIYTSSQSTALTTSYAKALDAGVANSGYLNHFYSSGSADATVGSTYTDQFLYSLASKSASPVEVADIRTYANGDTVLISTASNATPVPPSVLLMGSGLLGLIGIRRKMIA